MNEQPDTRTLEGKIAVMQADLSCKRIQASWSNSGRWHTVTSLPCEWNWSSFDYRIHPDDLNPPRKPREVFIGELFNGSLGGFAGACELDCFLKIKDTVGYVRILKFREVIETSVPVLSTDSSPPKELKWRAWTAEEVPVGSVIRCKVNLRRTTIIADMGCDVFKLGHDECVSVDHLFLNYTLLDGSPCGVKE